MAKFCSGCGASCQDDFVTCPYCGNNLNSDQVNNQNYQNNQGYQNYQQQNFNNQQQPYGSVELKSKMVAGILGLLLGGWGIHNFYLGYTNKAILQIVLSLVTCGVSSWWGFIEGIMILCGKIDRDAQGRPLKD